MNSEFVLQALEARQLMSAAGLTHFESMLTRVTRKVAVKTVGTNINLTKLTGNQAEGAITIDPTHPLNMFAMSNSDEASGMFAAVSKDGGSTWQTKIIADGGDNLVPACCDPSVAFDSFGNLFIGYVNSATTAAVIAISTNGGTSFSRLKTFGGEIDQPTITTGPGSVWTTFEKEGGIIVSGAKVTGKGGGKVGTFTTRTLNNSDEGNFGDIAVGPAGQVVVAYENPSDDSGPANIFVHTDLDGLGPKPFSARRKVSRTNTGGFEFIPPQKGRSIDAEPALAFDRSKGKFRGRLYMVYTDEKSGTDTDIYLRFSKDNGATWSSRIKVNNDTTSRCQFLPRLAVDASNGNLAVTFHDSRNVAADEAQFFGALGTPTTTGVKFSPNFKISGGTSKVSTSGSTIDYGDFTGLAYFKGKLFPIWADNSNSTNDNPDGSLNALDIYTAKVTVG